MSSSDEIGTTPPILKPEAASVRQNLLPAPAKSKDKYNRTYDQFMLWRANKNVNSFAEGVFLAYFSEQSKNKKSSTLWSIYSMLKCTVEMKHKVNIKDFSNLTMFLKRQHASFKSKKSKVLTGENVDRFLKEAPDAKYLAIKVALIVGINGACRTIELTNINTKDIENHENTMIIKLCDTKTKLDRVFVIRGENLGIVRKYEALHPPNTKITRFFLNYKDGKCTRQPIGKHKIASMPKDIAEFLNLTDTQAYTGHCFRRTSATLLADSGANLTSLKRLGGWKSDKVAEGYIEDSIENKSEISNKINKQIKLETSRHHLHVPCPQASTSCNHLQPSSPQASTSRHHLQPSNPQASTSCNHLQPSSPQASTSRHHLQPSSPQASTSRHHLQECTPQASTSRHHLQECTPQASTSRSPLEKLSPRHFTSQENLSASNPETASSQIQQTSINAPGKTIKFLFKNCPNMTNITFNIN